jgi:hypothetical protein
MPAISAGKAPPDLALDPACAGRARRCGPRGPIVGPRRSGAVRRTRFAALVALLAVQANAAGPAPEVRNWFDDPFFQVSQAIAGCPQALGPFMTEAERRQQAHHRAERGTTCWLSGACDKPNAYAYDRDIAEQLRKVLADLPAVRESTLWVTVQGRVVFIEGCVKEQGAARILESAARTVPNVQQAVAAVYTNPRLRPPYRVRESTGNAK